MAARKAHGNGADALLRVETVAKDLPAGVPAPARGSSPDDRGEGKRFARGSQYTADMASEGGKRRQGRTRLASQLSLTAMDADPSFGPYKRSAEAFRVAHCRSIAESIGGGICGTGPSSIVASAALALAASRYLYDTAGGDPELLTKAATLADKSRQSLLTAHELAAREAQSRPKPDAITALRARLGAK